MHTGGSDSEKAWFTKGFIDGLRWSANQKNVNDSQVQPEPSQPSRSVDLADLLYQVEEQRLQKRELKSHLDDAVGILQEMQGYMLSSLSNSTDSPLSSSPASATTSPIVDPSAPNSSFPSAVIARPRAPPPQARPRYDHVEEIRKLVPGYYDPAVDSPTGTTPDPIIERALNSLFRDAQISGSSSNAFLLVKHLCREAHGTTASARSVGQRYILRKWRNPEIGTWNTHPGLQLSVPLANPLANDTPEVWYAYLKAYPSTWPKGIRAHPESKEPIFELVVGSRIYALLRPEMSDLRIEFITALLDLFTVPGQYKALLRELQIPLAAQTSYRALGIRNHEGPLTKVDVAKHYASCGVTVEAVEAYVEPWAHIFEQDRRK
ncbi:hypothetical protein D9757_014300 [Collybiopsis confluens]|uniref:Uncharacterized protein n=1 Tax=Collybiopsis confluens TaxID=2823264 RepID=A0A8H5FSY9_9AGAR|nr:hypothetical protein D9757_014300 [Collybiopsis confluens]